MYQSVMLTYSDPTQTFLPPTAGSLAECIALDSAGERGAGAILGESAAAQRLRMQVRMLGPHFRLVLLLGEAGTGKEFAARALHSCSSHANGPFVRFECGRSDATAEELAEALKSAHRGTIYLRQIGAMRGDAQAALLAMLQRRERVLPGRIVVHGLEARIVASATDDPRVAVAAGDFLHGLHSRISAVTITLPSLRERMDDIPTLARYFLRCSGLDESPDLEVLQRATLSHWTDHRWPGNVRELKKMMQLAAEVSRMGDPPLQRMTSPPPEAALQPAPASNGAMRLHDVVEKHVFQVLKECSGNKVRAAEMLGISRSTLYRMLEPGPQGDKLVALR